MDATLDRRGDRMKTIKNLSMNEIDVNEELKIIENALRDIITFALNIKYGSDWLSHLKISEDKIKDWNEKKKIEEKKYKGLLIDNRILYYSGFDDLIKIIDKHWEDVFKEVFLDHKQIELLLKNISAYRISIAHDRELRDYQKHFLVGASGIIRHLITEYKADKDNENSYYPSFQNIYINDLDITDIINSIKLHEKNYHVGDEIEVSINAICPPDIKDKYAIVFNKEEYYDNFLDKDFSESNRKKYILKKSDIPHVCVHIAIQSDQYYHRHKNIDSKVDTWINVLPNKGVDPNE